MANRYKVIWQEWISTRNPNKPLQKELIEQSYSFKTRPEAEEFFELFKGDVRGIRLVDIVTSKVIREYDIWSKTKE